MSPMSSRSLIRPYDRLINEKVLVLWKSDNNNKPKNNNNVGGRWRLVPKSEKVKVSHTRNYTKSELCGPIPCSQPAGGRVMNPTIGFFLSFCSDLFTSKWQVLFGNCAPNSNFSLWALSLDWACEALRFDWNSNRPSDSILFERD